jgi:hypothetical protein
MDFVIDVARGLVELIVSPLDVFVPAVSLAIVAMGTAVVVLVATRWTSPQHTVGRARARMSAAIYEMRLYLDHPLALLRAQARLVGWIAVYFACLVPTAIALSAPIGLLYLHLEVRHGLAPLAAPSTAVVRIGLGPGTSPGAVAVEDGDGLAVTAPLVRAADEAAVYARVAIRRPGTHELVVRVGDATVTKRLVADPDAPAVAPERDSGVARFWSLGDESAPPSPAIRSIAVRHDERAGELPVRWWLYWIGLATIAVLLLRRRFDVEL